MKTERAALLLSASMALLMGIIGLGFALASDSRAILLDGLFNLTYFGAALVTLRVAHLTTQPDSDEFPFGHAYFESLVNAGKGLLILGISVVALLDALIALATGGRPVVAGLAIAYAAFATLLCSITGWLLYRSRLQADSPLVRADVENWVLNSLISLTVLAAFCLVPLMHWLDWPHATPYVDPLLVALIVVICLGVPIRMASRSIQELLNRAPSAEIRRPVEAAIDATLAQLPVRGRHIRMVRPGRTLYVSIHVILPPDCPIESLTTLDEFRTELDAAVRGKHPRAVVDTMFTAREYWAAPKSGLHPPGAPG